MLNRISIHGEHPPGCCLPHVGGKQEHSPARWGKTNSHNTAVEPPKEILAAATSSDSAGLSKHLGLPLLAGRCCLHSRSACEAGSCYGDKEERDHSEHR